MIAFDSLELGFGADKLKAELYKLFFVWQNSTQRQGELGLDDTGIAASQAQDQPIKYDPRKEEENRQKEEEMREERRKKAQLKRDQDLIEFEERGGFVRVLRDIFNPIDQAAMQLDSVYQLKNMCKNFYTRKQMVNQDLIQTLDALANERPTTLKMKRRHLTVDDSESSHCAQNVQWMRINAERERIHRFKQISTETASQYYKILERFGQLLIRKKADALDSTSDEVVASDL